MTARAVQATKQPGAEIEAADDAAHDAGRAQRSATKVALERFLASHRGLDVDEVAVELDRLRRVTPLAHVVAVWDLSFTDVAAMFSVSRQAVAKWMSAGVPADRSPAVADLAAATDLLVHHLKRDRIPAVVRRAAPGLGGASLFQLAAAGDTRGVLAGTRAMFAFDAANA